MQEEYESYKRQYVIGPEAVQLTPSWKTYRVSESLTLSYDDALDLQVKETGSRRIIGLGVFLSWRTPEAGNGEVFAGLAAEGDTLAGLLAATHRLNGRWIMLYADLQAGRTVIFHDASGSMQLFYDGGKAGLRVASQPHLLAGLAGTTPAPAAEQFMAERAFRHAEHAWIGDTTPYPGVKHVLPNFYLCVEEAEVCRYWPDPAAPVPLESPDDAAAQLAVMLRETIRSISHRYVIWMAVTAGWDSRTLLAACRDQAARCRFYVCRHPRQPPWSNDLQVPRRMFRALGLPFSIINCTGGGSPRFVQALRKNVYQVAADKNIGIYYRKRGIIGEGAVDLHGAIGDIARIADDRSAGTEADAEALAGYFGRRDAFTLEACREWLRGLYAECPDFKRLNVNLYDLFYWEQRLGNWGAMGAAEADGFYESLRPFNSREILVKFLSVPDRSRHIVASEINAKIIGKLWPELLHYPINPYKRWLGVLKKVGLYAHCKKLFLLYTNAGRSRFGNGTLPSR